MKTTSGDLDLQQPVLHLYEDQPVPSQGPRQGERIPETEILPRLVTLVSVATNRFANRDPRAGAVSVRTI